MKATAAVGEIRGWRAEGPPGPSGASSGLVVVVRREDPQAGRLRERLADAIGIRADEHGDAPLQILVGHPRLRRRSGPLATLEHYLLAFQHRYQAMAQPFRWTFTRADLPRLLANLTAVRPAA